MAHNIQEFRGRHLLLRDFEVLVVMAFTSDRLSDGSRSLHLKQLADSWRRGIDQYGPGVIDLKLDHFADTDEAVEEFVDALRSISAELSACGETIPKDTVNGCLRSTGVVALRDQETAAYIQVIAQLIDFVTSRPA